MDFDENPNRVSLRSVDRPGSWRSPSPTSLGLASAVSIYLGIHTRTA